MQNFIVLGIIPGTNFQATFTFWLTIACGFGALFLVPKVIRKVSRAQFRRGLESTEQPTENFTFAVR